MALVRIVTDSSSNFWPGEARELNIEVIPLFVRIDGEGYRDGLDITPSEFFAKLSPSSKLETSQPSLGNFVEAYKRLGLDTKQIISIHLTSQLSGTCSAAWTAKESMKTASPGLRIEVVDSLSISFSLGFLAVKAAEMAKKGADTDSILEEVNRLIPKTRLYGVLDTLDYLRRGGRIGKLQFWAASLLHTKPIVKFEDGVLSPVARPRTKKKAVAEMIKRFTEEGEMQKVAVIHTAAEKEAKEAKERLKEDFPELNIAVGEIGPALGVHAGPGLVGICGLLE